MLARARRKAVGGSPRYEDYRKIVYLRCSPWHESDIKHRRRLVVIGSFQAFRVRSKTKGIIDICGFERTIPSM